MAARGTRGVPTTSEGEALTARIREAKPPWSAVPREVKDEVARILGSPVARATITYGGYGPSATYRLVLRNGRRAFFKGAYPLPAGSEVIFPFDAEERRYRALATIVGPYAPRFHDSFRVNGWHVFLMEDVGPATMPAWTLEKTERAARSYAAFHRRTMGARLPRFLSRTQHEHFGLYWGRLAKGAELARTAALAKRRAPEAQEWLDVALPVFRDLERGLARARRPFVLLHFDTRSDNVRLRGDRLVMFDWPFASVGPAEFDVAAFAQAIAAEGGPLPERVLEWYEAVLPLRSRELDAAAAGIAGYFADRAGRPPVAGLPRLRSIQRRQMVATLGWAARRFSLPEPRWLDAVAE